MNQPDYSVLPGENPNRQRKKSPSIFPLLMLGLMAFFLYTQYQGARAKQREQAQQPRPAVPEQTPRSDALPEYPEIQIPDISGDGRLPAQAPPRERQAKQPLPKGWPGDDSGWSVDTDIPTHTHDHAHGDDRTESGDWSMEVSDSTGTGTATKSPPKKTENGDWEISEVETKK